jgi:hypothetical protein
MPADPLNMQPPDETGTDTFRRYLYQAYLAVPYCLECVSGGKVRSIVMEHFEDLTIEYDDYWYFVQVKTRNPDLGPWRLTHAINGLKSLFRTFEVLKDSPATYGLHLEGAIASDDVLNELVPPKSELSNSLRSRILSKLNISKSECDNFLSKTTVQPNQPNRDEVIARNLRLLGHLASHTPFSEIEAKHEKLASEVLAAMARERLSDLIPLYIKTPDSMKDDLRSRVESKRITRETLKELLGSIIEGPLPLLHRLVETQLPQPSELEVKLITAGARDYVIKNAKDLRAMATIRKAEFLGAGLIDPEAELENVHVRLEVLSNAITQKHENSEEPIVHIWDELLSELTERAYTVDPNDVYKQDPFTLLGAICDLADECIIDWGVAIA